MGEPRSGTCALWATLADLPEPCSGYGTNPGLMTDALQLASDVLFRLSGRRWPGVCTTSPPVRPYARQRNEEFPLRHRGWSTAGWGAGSWPWNTSWGYCSCNREDQFGCGSIPAISLGVEPLVSIDEVKVDGVVLAPALYRIDDYRMLVRLNNPDGTNPGWPCCQNMVLPTTQVGTWSVIAKYGRTPPAGVNLITGSYACELAKAFDPNVDPHNCRLPNRVVSVARQGVTMQMLDYSKILEEGLTGLPEVDTWIRSVNPNKLQRRARVWSPDQGQRVRRAGT